MSLQLTDPQKEFNEKYITVSEICDILDVHRAMISIWKSKGSLPGAISVGFGKTDRVSQSIWVREQIMPKINELKTYLEKRRTQK
jgi:hypothetical protein